MNTLAAMHHGLILFNFNCRFTIWLVGSGWKNCTACENGKSSCTACEGCGEMLSHIELTIKLWVFFDVIVYCGLVSCFFLRYCTEYSAFITLLLMDANLWLLGMRGIHDPVMVFTVKISAACQYWSVNQVQSNTHLMISWQALFCYHEQYFQYGNC